MNKKHPQKIGLFVVFGLGHFAMLPAMIAHNHPPLPFRAIAMDLDGTLLDTSGKISERTRCYLEILAGKGVHIILASGRMATRIVPFAEEVRTTSAIIAYNGAQVLEKSDAGWQVIYSTEVSAETRDDVYSLCRDRKLFLNIYSQDRLYAYHPSGDFRFCKLYTDQTGSAYAERSNDLADLPQTKITKVLIIEQPDARDRLYDELYPVFCNHATVVKSNPEYLEFLGKDTSKRSAMQFWMDRHDLSSSDLVAFGDAENDLPLLELARKGIAMANCTPGLRNAFNCISQWSNDENGIVRELEILYPSR